MKHRQAIDLGRLRERALQMLARREYSRAELRQRLSMWVGEASWPSDQTEAPDSAIERMLDDLAARGYLSDERYASQRVRQAEARWSNRRVANELRTKGVPEAIIDAALAQTTAEPVRAFAVWQRKYGGSPPADEREYAKQARFLVGRGFPADLIRRLLKDPHRFADDIAHADEQAG